MNKQFWHGRRVFLTGHTGFKGGWLSLWLQQLGAEVTGYALEPPTEPSIFEVANVTHGMSSIIGDVRDGDYLRRSIAEACPEVVIQWLSSHVNNYFRASLGNRTSKVIQWKPMRPMSWA